MCRLDSKRDHSLFSAPFCPLGKAADPGGSDAPSGASRRSIRSYSRGSRMALCRRQSWLPREVVDLTGQWQRVVLDGDLVINASGPPWLVKSDDQPLNMINITYYTTRLAGFGLITVPDSRSALTPYTALPRTSSCCSECPKSARSPSTRSCTRR